MKTDIMIMPATSYMEEVVLGELISFPIGGEIDTVAGILREEMFSSETSRKMWKAIVEEHASGMIPDAVSISKTVGSEYVGRTLKAASREGMSSLNVIRHAAVLRDMYCHRVAYMASHELMVAACDETSSETDILAIATKFIEQVQYTSNMDFTQGMAELGNILGELLEKGKPKCVPTGFPKLDALFRGGFPNGTLSILAGRPGNGKTSIGCFMMKKAAEAGYHSVMVSLEQPNIELYEKMMFGTGHLHPEEVDEGKILWNEFEKGVAELEKLPISLIDSASTLEDIVYYITVLKNHGKCDIAYVDYLGLIPVKIESGITMAQAIGRITFRLKKLAMQLHIPVVLMCQLNRDVAKERRMPILSDLRDSGNIEQDADKVLMVHRDDDEPNAVKLLVRKNRQGRAGNLYLSLKADDAYCNFYENE